MRYEDSLATPVLCIHIHKILTGITDWARLASDPGPHLSQHVYLTHAFGPKMASALIPVLENKKIEDFMS